MVMTQRMGTEVWRTLNQLLYQLERWKFGALALNSTFRSKLLIGSSARTSKIRYNHRAMRRRKVNKKDLIDGNAGLIFGNHFFTLEKTFAHRDQVYG